MVPYDCVAEWETFDISRVLPNLHTLQLYTDFHKKSCNPFLTSSIKDLRLRIGPRPHGSRIQILEVVESLKKVPFLEFLELDLSGIHRDQNGSDEYPGPGPRIGAGVADPCLQFLTQVVFFTKQSPCDSWIKSLGRAAPKLQSIVIIDSGAGQRCSDAGQLTYLRARRNIWI